MYWVSLKVFRVSHSQFMDFCVFFSLNIFSFLGFQQKNIRFCEEFARFLEFCNKVSLVSWNFTKHHFISFAKRLLTLFTLLSYSGCSDNCVFLVLRCYNLDSRFSFFLKFPKLSKIFCYFSGCKKFFFGFHRCQNNFFDFLDCAKHAKTFLGFLKRFLSF